MNKYTFGLPIILSLAIVIVIYVVHIEIESPKSVITDFSEKLKNNNLNDLIPFVTNEPNYVSKRSFEEFSIIHNFPEQKISDADSVIEANVNLITPIRPTYTGIELVEETVPTDLFFKQNRYVKEIVDLKEDGKEARARVKLGGWNSVTQELLGDIEYDIFLYKENDSWKIFKIILPKLNEKYDNYKFYAVSDNF